MPSCNAFFVLTGGPGAGKTSLLEALAGSGLRTMPEAGRAILRAHGSIGGPAAEAPDPLLFAELMLMHDIRSYEAACRATGPVIFDRGIPDLIGYLRLSGAAVPPHFVRAARIYRYADPVFHAPFWPAIYRTDEERRQPPQKAEATSREMVRAYRELGYEVVDLPRTDCEMRSIFVREWIPAPLATSGSDCGLPAHQA